MNRIENNNDKDIWVFLSHSNEDYDKVRLVRNLLEEQNFRPIMFFLKCLNDDDEIDSLIKREIDCRTRFIFCDSPNSRKSKWVKKELEYMAEKKRKIQTIDITKDAASLAEELKRYKGQSSIFLSYSSCDHSLATELYSRLQNYDFWTFMDRTNPSCGISFANHIKSSISHIAETKGIFIAVLSDNYMLSDFCKDEFQTAVNSDCHICVYNIGSKRVNKNDLEEWLGTRIPDFFTSPLLNDSEIVDAIISSILIQSFDLQSILIMSDDFLKGNNREKNTVEAALCFNLYQEKADQSMNPYAALSLARCYANGTGTEINLEKAYRYYTEVVYCEGLKQYLPEMKEVYDKMHK